MNSPTEPPLPVFFWPGDKIGLKQAQHIVGHGPRVIKKWCREHAIGFNSCLGAEWEISAPGLVAVWYRDDLALEKLRSGEREHPRVRRILDYLISLGELERRR